MSDKSNKICRDQLENLGLNVEQQPLKDEVLRLKDKMVFTSNCEEPDSDDCSASAAATLMMKLDIWQDDQALGESRRIDLREFGQRRGSDRAKEAEVYWRPLIKERDSYKMLEEAAGRSCPQIKASEFIAGKYPDLNIDPDTLRKK